MVSLYAFQKVKKSVKNWKESRAHTPVLPALTPAPTPPLLSQTQTQTQTPLSSRTNTSKKRTPLSHMRIPSTGTPNKRTSLSH
eukprot:Pgem_evm1s6059